MPALTSPEEETTQMLYRVTVYKPARGERYFYPADSRVVGNLKVAKLVAREALKPYAAQETTYSARVTRRPYVQIHKVPFGANHPFGGGKVATVEAPVTIVPSVGDLGYTP